MSLLFPSSNGLEVQCSRSKRSWARTAGRAVVLRWVCYVPDAFGPGWSALYHQTGAQNKFTALSSDAQLVQNVTEQAGKEAKTNAKPAREAQPLHSAVPHQPQRLPHQMVGSAELGQSREFMQPLLHIGYHKTGTTWLQKCVFRNAR